MRSSWNMHGSLVFMRICVMFLSHALKGTHKYKYTHTHAHTELCTKHVCTHTHTHTHTYIHTHVYTHTSSIASLATFTSSSSSNFYIHRTHISNNITIRFKIPITSGLTSSGRQSPGNLALVAASCSLALVTSSGSSLISSIFFFPSNNRMAYIFSVEYRMHMHHIHNAHTHATLT